MAVDVTATGTIRPPADQVAPMAGPANDTSWIGALPARGC